MTPQPKKKLNAFVIDDEQYSIDLLEQELERFAQIESIGSETNHARALKSVKSKKTDLIFMDVEMPGKTGFEVLRDIRNHVDFNFHVIFHTAYDKYAIQAIRESALDFILKPVQLDELKAAIGRLNEQERIEGLKGKTSNKLFPHPGDIITMPTHTGIRFLKCNEIICLKYKKEKGYNKGYWIVCLYNPEELRLRAGLNAKKLFEVLGEACFMQVNQSAIVNLNYVNTIEIKTKQCILLPPYEKTDIPISRSCMGEIRGRFEVM